MNKSVHALRENETHTHERGRAANRYDPHEGNSKKQQLPAQSRRSEQHHRVRHLASSRFGRARWYRWSALAGRAASHRWHRLWTAAAPARSGSTPGHGQRQAKYRQMTNKCVWFVPVRGTQAQQGTGRASAIQQTPHPCCHATPVTARYLKQGSSTGSPSDCTTDAAADSHQARCFKPDTHVRATLFTSKPTALPRPRLTSREKVLLEGDTTPATYVSDGGR